jgi:hypothetical protein
MKNVLNYSLLLVVLSGALAIPSTALMNKSHEKLLALFAIKKCEGTTPSGKFVVKSGAFKDETINYEDPRGKHTCFAKRTQSELEALVKNPSTPLEREFSQAFKNKNKNVSVEYGSQFNKEASSTYETLLKEAIEKGVYNQSSGKILYKFDFLVGADTEAGLYTKGVRVDGVNKGGSNGVHMFPIN